jgi:hypothetical protein
MTSERTKAVLFMVLTFMVGIVIGVFIPGIVFRFRAPDNLPPLNARNMPPPSDRFERMIFRMVEPDSNQMEKIRPLAQKTSARIDTIQSQTNKEIKGVIDSLKSNLKPILTPEQLKKLEDFGNRPRGFGRGGQEGRPGGPGSGGPGSGGPRGDRPDDGPRGGERPGGSF